METQLEILKRSPLFGVLPDHILRSVILSHGQLRELSKGSHFIAPQQKTGHFGVVLSGKIHISHIFSDGSFSLINVLVSGEAIGADLICTPSRISPYHAIAVTNTRILQFPAALVLQPGILDEPYRLKLLSQLLMLIANENMKKEYRLAILSQKGLRQRIMVYLTMQASKRKTDTFSIPFSREELASYLCVNRSALSHELSLLQQEGVIRFHKNTFTML